MPAAAPNWLVIADEADGNLCQRGNAAIAAAREVAAVVSVQQIDQPLVMMVVIQRWSGAASEAIGGRTGVRKGAIRPFY